MDDNRRVDLHLHTIYSDGDLTPAAVVSGALERGLAAIAVTDHDTVMGIEPVLCAAGGTDLEVVPGVELSASDGDLDIHVLGYFIDWKNSGLVESLAAFREKRHERALEMVRRLREIGLPVRIDLVLRFAGDGSVGRPHVARALLEQGLIRTFDEAFIRYIGYRGPAYVPKLWLRAEDAFALIRQAGGVAALAHPGTLGRDDLIPRFVQQGMEALEVWHPSHDDGDWEHYEELASEYGLIKTGGSDSHGGRTGLPNFSLIDTTYASVRALKEALGKRSSGR